MLLTVLSLFPPPIPAAHLPPLAVTSPPEMVMWLPLPSLPPPIPAPLSPPVAVRLPLLLFSSLMVRVPVLFFSTPAWFVPL